MSGRRLSVDSPAADLDLDLAARTSSSLGELFELLAIPSISTRAEHRGDVEGAARWLGAAFARVGFEVGVHPTPGHPIVLAEWRRAPAGAPTVLLYGHYDVQPPEPLEPWWSPPFAPEVRNGRLYARGATDDKGQLFLHLEALRAHLRVRGRLPVNLVALIEGEEEIGSPNLAPFVARMAERLRCDAVVISDSAMFAPLLPSLITALRGIAYFELELRGPAGELHSGSYGGAVVNPANALARMLATLHDRRGRIAIDGFHDRVRTVHASRRRRIARLPFDPERFRVEAGVSELGGEAGYSPLERLWIRPSCDVHGVWSGYAGEGAKTVIPAGAGAKLSFRLVPRQRPEEIELLVRRHFEAVVPRGVQFELHTLLGARPWFTDLPEWLLGAATRALVATFGREPVLVADGGTLPVLTVLDRLLGAPILLMGFGQPGENTHAPNEWLDLDCFERGLRTAALLWDEIGRATCVRPQALGTDPEEPPAPTSTTSSPERSATEASEPIRRS